MNSPLLRRAMIAFEQRMRAQVRIHGRGNIIPVPVGMVGRMAVINYPFQLPAGCIPKRKTNARKSS